MPTASLNRKLEYHLLQLRDAATAIAGELYNGFDRKTFAEAFCATLLESIWNERIARKQGSWALPTPPANIEVLDTETRHLAINIGSLAAGLDIADAGYFVGTVYTSLLPADIRTNWGVYYTPPSLVERLLSNAEHAGVDWARSRIIDPACGGAAFLAPIAERIWRALSNQNRSPQQILRHISDNLSGLEIDPFAAWMSQVLTEFRLLDLMVAASERLPTIVRAVDSLQHLVAASQTYDLVIGNPPYGKVRLSEKMRTQFGRSVYGHANLYGLFTDLALRVLTEEGIVAFVTPTSFLSGQYFKALRRLLAAEAPPAILDFVFQRDGIFDDVLQETVLVVFKKKSQKTLLTRINTIHADRQNGGIKIIPVTQFSSAKLDENPWLLPRDGVQHDVLRSAIAMKSRLSDYGLTVVTGQLVWNRHKEQLQSMPGEKSLPLIWAESVLPDGTFRFRALRANHKPFFNLRQRQDHLVTREECLLVQRTTAKEQHRRLLCAVLPKEFIQGHGGGVVIENHLNIIKQERGLLSSVSLRTVCVLLNSQIVDQVFRCISGSVAVSAYELNTIPLPDPESLLDLEKYLDDGYADRRVIEDMIAQLYGVN